LSLRKRANEDKKEDKLTKRGFLISGGNWFNTKQLSLRKRANKDKRRVKRDFKVTKGAHMTDTKRVEVATKKPLSEQAVTGLLKNFFNKKRSVREHKRGFLITGGNWHNTKQLSLRKRAEEDKKEDKLTKRGFLITGGNWFNTKQLSLRKRADDDIKAVSKRDFKIDKDADMKNTKVIEIGTKEKPLSQSAVVRLVHDFLS